LEAKTDYAIKSLQTLGLSNPEARAYLSVVKLGLCTIAQVARESGLQRTDVYRLMPRLVDSGLAEETLDKPRRYKARDVKESVSALSDKLTSELAEISQQSRRLVDTLELMRKFAPQREEPYVRIVTGLRDTQHNFRDALAGASEDIWAIAPRSFTADHKSRFLSQTVASKHLKARIILPVDRSNLKRARRLSSVIDVRHHHPLGVHLCGIGNQYVCAGLNIPEQTDPSRISELVTTYPDYIRTMHEFFEMIWDQSVPLEIHSRSLSAKRSSRGLTTVVWGRNVIYNLTRWEESAQRRLAIITTRGGPQRILGRFRKFYTNLRERGVKVQIICSVTPENARFAKELGTIAEVRHNDCLFGISFAILDRSEALIHYIYPDSPDAYVSADDMALLVTNLDVVRQLGRMFDYWWRRSVPLASKLKQPRRAPRMH